MSKEKKDIVDIASLYVKKTNLPVQKTILMDDEIYSKLKFLQSQIPYRSGQNLSVSYFVTNVVNMFFEDNRESIEKFLKDNQKNSASMF